jgi:actin-like protein 6A
MTDKKPNNPLVVNVGGFCTRAGEAGDDMPKAVFPSNLGCVVSAESKNMIGEGPTSIGEADDIIARTPNRRIYYVDANELAVYRSGMEILSPIIKGVVNDWDGLEKLWDYAFYKCLGVDPAGKPLLFTESLLTSKDHREKLTEIIFEKYKPSGFFVAKEPTLSSFACGRSTSLVVDSGADMTLVTAVHDGYALQRTMSRSNVAGNFITDALNSNIQPRVQHFGEIRPKYLFSKRQHKGKWEISLIPRKDATVSYHNYQVKLILNDLKETLCRVSEEPFDESSAVSLQSYELPDGNIIQLEKEKYRVTELMFQTGSHGSHSQSTRLQEMVINTITHSDADIHKDLYGNIIVTGGNSLFKGYPERLQKELTTRVTTNPIKIIASPNSAERRFSTWIGGSILASVGSFHQMWMSKEEYEEVGKTLVHSKCP